MPLSPGDKLGPYTILALAGKGGMGEVYRAHDDRLRRDVAIKVSRDQFTERFTREARTIASLNHTNIAHLYDVGPNYLVMEYVEGDDLKGPLSFEDALPIIQQLIDGIEAAHEKNIIHRDLKPANIKITPEGVVKILDFGLAKAMEPPPSHDDDPGNSPTLTMGGTVAGTILGTAAYMAPEQAKGKAADKRSDVWSFGVVVYEMLTGKRLFQGETVVEILGCVLNKEPDISAAPPRVQELLGWCLEKNRKQRLQAIGDARRMLEKNGTGSQPHQSKRPWIAAAAVGLIAAAAFAAIHFFETPPEVRVMNSTLLPPDGAEFVVAGANLATVVPAISPDGTRIVFGARVKDGNAQLWVRRLDSSIAQPLPGTEDASSPFWSPDGRWVGFGQGRTLKKIDVQGGPPLVVATLSSNFSGGSWSPQGVILIAGSGRGDASLPLLRVPASGGKPVPAVGVEAGKETEDHRFPWFLPDGKHFLYTTLSQGDIPVRVGSLDEPEKPGKVVAQAHSNVVYSQGNLLYLREQTLMAQPFDARLLETKGEAVRLAEGIATYATYSRRAGFTVSTGGLLVYTTGGAAGGSRLVWKDRQGKTLGNLEKTTASIGDVDLSPDQQSASATINTAGNADVWIYDIARGIPTRFTFDPKRDAEGVWSPDGKTIYFASNRKGAQDLYRKASNGSGNEELLLGVPGNKTPTSVSPNGRMLLYVSGGGEPSGSDLWVLPLSQSPGGGKVQPQVFLQTPFNEFQAKFSPDGQWVVYASNESGQNQVYVAPFPGPGGKRQISVAGGRQPRWRRDGKEVFYTAGEGQLMAAEVAARNGTLEVGREQKLFDGIVTGRGIPYDVSADGQKFLVMEDNVANATVPLTLVQNWTSLLKK